MADNTDNSCDTATILIGKNAADNWKIVDEAENRDLWFHVANHPSCHVILKAKDINFYNINLAAQRCKEHSKLRNLTTVTVMYTTKDNIKKGQNVGEVIIKSNKKCKKVLV